MQHLLVLPSSTIFAELLKRLNLLGKKPFWIEEHRLPPETQPGHWGSASQLMLVAGVQTSHVWSEFKAHQSCAGEVPDTLSHEQRGWLHGKAVLPLQSWFSFANWQSSLSYCSLGISSIYSNRSSSWPFAGYPFIKHHGDFRKLSSFWQTPGQLGGHLPFSFPTGGVWVQTQVKHKWEHPLPGCCWFGCWISS